MKYSIATLLWLTIVIALATCCFLLFQEAKQAEALLQESIANLETKHQADQAALLDSVKADLLNSAARAMRYESKLGHFSNQVLPSQNVMKLYRLPDEFGGRLSTGLPFHWYWRFQVANPKSFQINIATGNIPSEGFEVDNQLVSRFVIENEGANADERSQYQKEPVDLASTVQFVLVVSVYPSDEGGFIKLRAQFESPPSPNSLPRMAASRYQVIKLTREQMSWISKQLPVSMSDWRISDFGSLEQEYETSQKNFDVQKSPQLMMRIRGKKEFARMRYEEFDGPAPGMMLWIDKKVD